MVQSVWRAAADFVLRACATDTSRISVVGDIVIRLWNFSTRAGDQKLSAHFSEAGAAIFAIEQVEYGGHDHPRR